MKKDIKWVSLTGKRIFKFGNWTRCEYIRSYTQNSYSKHYSIQFLKMLVCSVCLMWIVLRGFFLTQTLNCSTKREQAIKLKKKQKQNYFLLKMKCYAWTVSKEHMTISILQYNLIGWLHARKHWQQKDY